MKSLELCIESIFTFWVLHPSERASGNLGFLRTRFCKNRTFKAIFLMAQTLAHGSVDLFVTTVTYIFTFHKKIHGQLNALGDFRSRKWRNFEKMAFSRGRISQRQRSPMIFFVFSCSLIHKKLIRSPPESQIDIYLARSTRREMSRNVEKCREMSRKVEKCREMSSFENFSDIPNM